MTALPVQKYLNKQLLGRIKDEAGVRRCMIKGRCAVCTLPCSPLLITELGWGAVQKWGRRQLKGTVAHSNTEARKGDDPGPALAPHTPRGSSILPVPFPWETVTVKFCGE